MPVYPSRQGSNQWIKNHRGQVPPRGSYAQIFSYSPNKEPFAHQISRQESNNKWSMNQITHLDIWGLAQKGRLPVRGLNANMDYPKGVITQKGPQIYNTRHWSFPDTQGIIVMETYAQFYKISITRVNLLDLGLIPIWGPHPKGASTRQGSNR